MKEKSTIRSEKQPVVLTFRLDKQAKNALADLSVQALRKSVEESARIFRDHKLPLKG
jgi:hypothetical protein